MSEIARPAAMNLAPPGAYRRGQHAARRGVWHGGDLFAGRDAVAQEIDEQEQDEHRGEARDGGAADVVAVAGALGEHGGALHSDEHPDRHQHHGLDLGERGAEVAVGAPEIGGEGADLEGGGPDDDEDDQGHDLGDGHDDVDDGRLADAAQDEQVVQPQERRGDDGGQERGALPESGQEYADRRHEEDEVSDIAHPGAEPVAPGRGEAQIIAEPFFGVAVDARIDIGALHGQALEDLGQHEHSGSGDEPSDDERAGGRRGAHLRWQTEYSPADH